MAWIIQDVPQKYRRELAKRVPEVSFGLFEWAVSNYLAAREESDPSPKMLRTELDRVVVATSRLSEALSGLSFPALDALDDEALRFGAGNLRQRLKADLDGLFNCAEVARRKADARVKTNNPNDTTRLIGDLARAVRAAGLVVDQRPEGPLALIFKIALDFLDERLAATNPGHKALPGRASTAKTLGNALATLGKD